jgi:hypothetical protein
VTVRVIPTDEEAIMAEIVSAVLENKGSVQQSEGV